MLAKGKVRLHGLTFPSLNLLSNIYYLLSIIYYIFSIHYYLLLIRNQFPDHYGEDCTAQRANHHNPEVAPCVR